MKVLILLTSVMLFSCTHDRQPASVNGHPVAYTSTAFGNVQAQATKINEKQDVCFDIQLDMKNVKEDEVKPSNWTMSWVDQKNQHHPLDISARSPASTPKGGQVIAQYGAYERWTNTFYTCAKSARSAEVKELILTPKESSYKDKDIVLTWK